MKKNHLIFLIALFLIISGCTEKPLAVLTENPIEIDMAEEFDPYSAFTDVQDGAEISYELDEENSKITFVVRKGDKEERFEDIDVTLIYPSLTAPFKAESLTDMEIYSEPSADSLLKGYVRSGDRFEVFEIKEQYKTNWCRIADNYWLKVDSLSALSIISYDTDVNIIHDEMTFYQVPDTLKGIWYERYTDGILIEEERYYAESIDNQYDDHGRLICEILHKPYETETYRYTYDSNSNIIKVTRESDEFVGMDTFLFSYDDKNRLITESGYGSNPIKHIYDENGNIIKLENDRTDEGGFDESLSFEYNGSLRFEYCTKEYEERLYTKDTTVFRYDDNGIMIELFFAGNGDIRNGIAGYK